MPGPLPSFAGVPTATAPPLPSSFSRADLEAAGFEGWMTWADLRADDLAAVQCAPSCYVVFCPSAAEPAFVDPSPGGWFKGQDPSVPVERLQAEWVPGAAVVYIGKA